MSAFEDMERHAITGARRQRRLELDDAAGRLAANLGRPELGPWLSDLLVASTVQAAASTAYIVKVSALHDWGDPDANRAMAHLWGIVWQNLADRFGEHDAREAIARTAATMPPELRR